MNKLAVEHGTTDAQEWLQETPREDWADAIKPGTLGADEFLLNSIGVTAAALAFGIEYADEEGEASEEFLEACRDYSRAWADTVRAAIASDE